MDISILYPIFHKLDYCVEKELKNCETVLDLGCGPSSSLRRVKHIKYSIGVEIFKPYLNLSKKQKIHTEYLQKNILNLDFPKNSFDAVMLIEVIEHLSRKNGQKILKLANKWAKKKIILSTPNNFFPMNKLDQNPYQKHLSGWSASELQKKGYKIYGVSGIKFFYKEKCDSDTMVNGKGWQNIRFKPQPFFYGVNAIFQIFNYYFPRFTFGLFAVKNK